MYQADRHLLLPNSSRQSSSLSLPKEPLSADSEAANIDFITTPCLIPGCQLLEQVARNWMEMDASKLPTHLNPCSLAASVGASLLCFLLSLRLFSLPNMRQALLQDKAESYLSESEVVNSELYAQDCKQREYKLLYFVLSYSSIGFLTFPACFMQGPCGMY